MRRNQLFYCYPGFPLQFLSQTTCFNLHTRSNLIQGVAIFVVSFSRRYSDCEIAATMIPSNVTLPLAFDPECSLLHWHRGWLVRLIDITTHRLAPSHAQHCPVLTPATQRHLLAWHWAPWQHSESPNRATVPLVLKPSQDDPQATRINGMLAVPYSTKRQIGKGNPGTQTADMRLMESSKSRLAPLLPVETLTPETACI